MEREMFAAALEKEGFSELVTVEREPNGGLDVHAHPFEAKALVLDGEISIAVGGQERTYRRGEIFHLKAGEPHTERYGAQGVHYLVGRRAG